ncbi:MAG: family rane protein [Bacillales bacterium]|nr:family rane protein [Bacillales bacterium]
MFIIESRKLGRAVFYGVVSIFIFAAISSLLFSLILRFTDVKESSVSYIVLFLSFLSLFIGGFISGGKGKRSGWMLGSGVGLIYTLIVFLYQYLGLDTLFSAKQLIYYASYILTAMMGGILGVNMTSGPTTR